MARSSAGSRYTPLAEPTDDAVCWSCLRQLTASQRLGIVSGQRLAGDSGLVGRHGLRYLGASLPVFSGIYAAFRRDPRGEHHLLVPVRVQPCDVEGLLGSIIYINLVSLEEQEARTALLEGVRRERVKPSSAPFPREARAPTPPPAFPNMLPSVWT